MENVLKIINKYKKYLGTHYVRFRLYLSFVFLGITMVWPGSRWLIFVALIPLITYLPHMQKMTRRQVLKDFYFSGFILCGFANLFLFQVAPENWTIQLQGWFGVVSRLMSWLLICGFCALSYGLLGVLLHKIKSFKRQLVLLPLLFPLAEILRSYLFAAMAYGPNGSFSPNFNWGSIAVPASGTAIVYASRIVGFFGLTLLVVLINTCIYLLITRRRTLLPISVLLSITLLVIVGWNIGNKNSDSTMRLKAAVLHMNENNDMTTIDSALWPSEGTDILVLPEYSALLKYKDYKKMLGRLSKNGVAITTTDNGRSPTGTNRIVILNRNGDIVNSQDKTFLIPTGEYVPYSLQLGFRLIGKAQALEDFRYTQQLSPGDTPETPYVHSNGMAMGVLACSGVSALNEYSRLTDSGADVLANSASLAFLLPNSLYHVYARDMARFQTISNNRPFLQASRSGQSYMLNNQGQTLIESINQKDQLLTYTIDVQK